MQELKLDTEKKSKKKKTGNTKQEIKNHDTLEC